MIVTFKVLSVLLSYPERALVEEARQLADAIARERLVPARMLGHIEPLLGELASGDLYDLQERYVHLFDRTRSLSLHLFEHVHGESRDRGQAMVDLMNLYEEQGLAIEARELPDYLPMFLEFLSMLEFEQAQALLGEPLHIVSALRERLQKRGSSYAGVLMVLEALAAARPDRAALDALLAEPEDDPDDLEALDVIWEDEAVTFGGNAGEGACGPDRLRTRLRAAQRTPSSPSNPDQV